MSNRNRGKRVTTIMVTASLIGVVGAISLSSPSFASGPANGSQVPGSAVPIGSFTAGTPFSSGQNIEITIPANSNLQPGAGINILECADPGGTVANLPSSINQCDGNTIQGSTVFVNSNGSVLYSPYELFALPDRNLGEPSNGAPVCNTTSECVLFIGQDQNNFAGAPHYFSQPFFVAPNATDNGAHPGDGSPQGALISQTITFTSTPPNPALVGGTYTPMASGGDSGNPVVFTIDAASTTGACSFSGSMVRFTNPGTCKIDANQAGTSAYSAAPQVSQSVVITKPGPAITSANNATATEGVPFTYRVTTSGTPTPKLKEKGKLPKGIKFRKGVGSATITGTPNPKKNKTLGTYHVTITATFGKGKTKELVSQAFTLRVVQ